MTSLQSIYVKRDRVILKFEARVQIYPAVLNSGCKIQNSGGNVACVVGGIVRVRGKILTLESEYGWRSREENGKEPF